MSSRIDGLRLRRTWGRDEWHVPIPYSSIPGASKDGWLMQAKDYSGSVIADAFDYEGAEWVHASIGRAEQVPSYDDLVTLHRSVWGRGGWSYQYFMPESKHVNFHPHVLHLWGRLDGQSVMPDFVAYLGDL